MFRIQTNMAVCDKRHMSVCFGNCFSLQRPQIHHIANKNGFIASKNVVSISSLNQGNHNMGHLWINTDHNLDHKGPDYGQPVTINMYDQTMISLESCCIYYGRVWLACFCMGGQPGYPSAFAQQLLPFSGMKILLATSVWFYGTTRICENQRSQGCAGRKSRSLEHLKRNSRLSTIVIS